MFKPLAELNEYISLVTLDFMGPIYCNSSRIYIGDKRVVSIENERQINTRIGIIALIKLYKNMPLSIQEQQMLANYPLENDYKTELEWCIAYIAFKIGQNAWNKVNNIRLEMEAYERQNNIYRYLDVDEYGMVTSYSKNRAYTIKVSPSDAYGDYLKCLEEYNSDLLHAWVYHHGISLMTSSCEQIKPVLDFDSECFMEVIPKTSRIMSLIRNLIKRESS